MQSGAGHHWSVSRLARGVRLERAIDGAGIAIENVADAIGAIEVDRIEDIDVGLEDADVAVAICPAYAAQPAGVAQYFRSRVARVGPVLQEHGDRVVVAMECRGMKRRVSGRSVDRGLLIVLHVDDRQARRGGA